MTIKNRLILSVYIVTLASLPCPAEFADLIVEAPEKPAFSSVCLTDNQYMCLKMSDQRTIPEESFHISEKDILRPLLCAEKEEACAGLNNACPNPFNLYFEDCEPLLSTLGNTLSTYTEHRKAKELTLLGHMLTWGIGTPQNPAKAYEYLYPLSYSTFYPPAVFHLFVLLAVHAQKLPFKVPAFIHVLSFAKQRGFLPAKTYWDKNFLIESELPKVSADLPAYFSEQNEAFLRINWLAKRENAQGLYIRALLSLTNQGITPFDPQAALIDLEKASTQGHTTASFLLGTLLYQGNQPPYDTPKALRDFQKLSTQIDDPEKKISLDIPKALAIFQKLADEGHTNALHMLITHYANNGEWELSESWVTKAKRHKDPLSVVLWFDNLTRLGGSLEKIQQAISWLQKHDKSETSYVQTRLGQIFFEGIYRPSNYELAEIYLTAATKDPYNYEAAYRLAILYIEYNGDKTLPNSSIARKTWGMNTLTALSEKGFGGAKIHLIHYLLYGGPCEKNLSKAEKLLKELPKTYTPTRYYSGLLWLEKGNVKKAKRYFLDAYADGSPNAAYELGKLYHQGRLSKQGQSAIHKAQTYLTFAVKRGHLGALQYLMKHFGYMSPYISSYGNGLGEPLRERR